MDNLLSPTMRRVLGGVLAVVAALSLLVSVVAAVQLWRMQGHLSEQVDLFLDQAGQTLETTAQALDVADDTIATTAQNLETLGVTLVLVADTLDGSRTTVGDVGGLLRADVPDAVRSTQTALRSAQQTAGLIDDTLESLSRVPLVGAATADYTPDVALGDALGDVGDSLDPVPGALEDVGRTIESAGDDLGEVSANIAALGSEVQEINTSVSGAADVIDQYRDQVDEYQSLVSDLRDSAPSLLKTLAVGLTFVLVWLAVLQAWVLAKGLQMLTADAGKGSQVAAASADAKGAQQTPPHDAASGTGATTDTPASRD